MQDIFSRYTMDTACEILFGVPDLNTLSMPLPQAGKARLGAKGCATESGYGGFAEAFEKVQVLVQMRGRWGPHLWPAFELWRDSTKEDMSAIHEWIAPLTQNAFEKRARNLAFGLKLDHSADNTLLDHLVSSTKGMPPLIHIPA
jgi:hypothetical protein